MIVRFLGSLVGGLEELWFICMLMVELFGRGVCIVLKFWFSIIWISWLILVICLIFDWLNMVVMVVVVCLLLGEKNIVVVSSEFG